jgi:hypothetical protein
MIADDISLPPPAVIAPFSPDLEKYRQLLGHIELTEEQANAILMEVWGFAFRCVEAQFTPPSIPDIFASLLLESSAFVVDEVESSNEIRSEVLACAGSENGCE